MGITKTKIFLFLSLGFLTGVFLSSFFLVEKFWSVAGAVFVLIWLIVFHERPYVLLSGIFLIFLSLGSFLVSNKLEEMKVIQDKNAGVTLEEKVFVSEVEDKKTYQLLTLELPENNLEILARTGIYPKFHYGDEVRVKCHLEVPENKDKFDYRMYLAKEKIYFICQNPQIETLQRNRGNFFFKSLYEIKEKLEKKISGLLPFPESGLLSGILLGGDDKLSKAVQENFSKTGTTHIVAVSGYNVTILSNYLMTLGIILGLWRRQAFWLGVLGVLIFIVMIGAPESAVRAGIMGTLLLWAIRNGRLGNSQNAVLFSASIMLLFNPLLLRWDVGFQLSFLATLGIVFVYPLMQDFLIIKGKVWGATRETLFLTFSAQAFVLPVILYNFGLFSAISPIANLLILPAIPVTMALGFLSIAADFFFPWVGNALAWLAYLFLHYEIQTVEFLASLKFAAWEWNLSAGGVMIWYTLLIGGIIYVRKKNNLSRSV